MNGIEMESEIKEVHVIVVGYKDEGYSAPIAVYDNRQDAIKMAEQVFTCMQKDGGRFAEDEVFDRAYGSCHNMSHSIEVESASMNDMILDNYNPDDFDDE